LNSRLAKGEKFDVPEGMELFKENELVKRFELPQLVTEVLGESWTVVYPLLDNILTDAVGVHILERIYKIEELDKVRPLLKPKASLKEYTSNKSIISKLNKL